MDKRSELSKILKDFIPYGKKLVQSLRGGMITKPPGKPTLVPNSDKRPALNTAKDDFKEEGENL